ARNLDWGCGWCGAAPLSEQVRLRGCVRWNDGGAVRRAATCPATSLRATGRATAIARPQLPRLARERRQAGPGQRACVPLQRSDRHDDHDRGKLMERLGSVSPTYSIPERIDRLPMSRELWRPLLLAGIAWLIESYDIGLIGSVLPSLQRQYG